MVYPRLITSMKWKFDCFLFVFFFEREKGENEDYHSNVLENLCKKVVLVVGETFSRKYYFIRISQSRRGHIYLIVQKKRSGLLWEETQVPYRKINDVSRSVFNWFCDENIFVSEHYFLDFKVLIKCSNYHFHYLLVLSNQYGNKYF